MKNLIRRVKPKREEKEIPFVISVAFWLTYLFIRLIVYLFPEMFVDVNGVHIHHFSYGIIILSIVGFYSVVFNPTGRRRSVTAALLGIGLALTYDEFGMWLHLRDQDVSRWGYDAVALISAGFLNFLYLDQYWLRLFRKVKSILPKFA